MERNYDYEVSGGDYYILCAECGTECLVHSDANYECHVCGNSGWVGEEIGSSNFIND